ncbi:MAG: hypothetical protein PHD68_04990 [Rugosibacter sp.]|nr:hypothetical protein [Rugosibacter sp.]
MRFPKRRPASADFSHASADAPSIAALGCHAGLVVAVTGVEAGQVQFAIDQMIQRGLVSMGL